MKTWGKTRGLKPPINATLVGKLVRPMIGENWQLLTNELVEFEK